MVPVFRSVPGRGKTVGVLYFVAQKVTERLRRARRSEETAFVSSVGRAIALKAIGRRFNSGITVKRKDAPRCALKMA